MFWIFFFLGVPSLQADEQPDAGKLFTLVTKPKRAPHKWMGGAMAAADATLSGHEERQWHCLNCTLLRLTVLFDGGANAERAYWYAGTDVQFTADVDPDCRTDLTTEAKAS